jgi:hypothetical protein
MDTEVLVQQGVGLAKLADATPINRRTEHVRFAEPQMVGDIPLEYD